MKKDDKIMKDCFKFMLEMTLFQKFEYLREID